MYNMKQHSKLLLFLALLQTNLMAQETQGPKAPDRIKKVQQVNAKISINQAGVETLTQLPGIGPVMAKRIVAYRKTNVFKSLDDLRFVKGIGLKTFENIKPLIKL